jgi:hypothetical protein
MGVGGGIAVLFLILSLKVADSALSYNPYRWMSSLHEWLAIIVLILETKLFLVFTHARPTLSHVVYLFIFAHILAAMLVYGVLFLIVRRGTCIYRVLTRRNKALNE